MPKVTFIATTLTNKGRFEAGESADFTEAQAKDLQRLSSVESPKKKKATVSKKKKAKEVKDDVQESTEK